METIDTTQAQLEAFILNYTAQPEIALPVDLSTGSVLSEWLIKLSAAIQNQWKNDSAAVTGTPSVASAISATGDTYSDAITNVASNFNVTRDAGDKATGKVKVVVASIRTYFINADFRLFQPSLNEEFQTTKAFRVDSAQADNADAGQLKLYSESANGPYYFLLPVAAVNVGDAPSGIRHNQVFVLGTNVKLTDFVQANAFGSFTGGRAKETDRALISRFQTGLSAKGMMSPISIQALLPTFFTGLPTVSASGEAQAIVAMLGANDPEVIRGKTNDFGISAFGLVDIYVRTSQTIETAEFTVNATKLNAGDDLYQIVLNSSISEFPAWFYHLESMEFNASSPQLVYSVYDDPPNKQLTPVTARYSKYQQATIEFTHSDPPSGAVVGDTTPVNIVVSYMPYIGEIQDLLLQSAHRVPAADYLVKAVIPCQVSVNLNLQVSTSQTIPVEEIKVRIFNYINGLQFGESLMLSKLVDICHDYPIRRVDLPLVATGAILTPALNDDDTAAQQYAIYGNDVLTIPAETELLDVGVSVNTTMFFADCTSLSNGRETISVNIT